MERRRLNGGILEGGRRGRGRERGREGEREGGREAKLYRGKFVNLN